MAHTISIALLCCCAAIATAAPKDGPTPRLIWEDNFDRLDERTWHHMVTAWRGGNDEFQYYRNNRKNSYVEDGFLKIRATPVNEEYSDDDIRYGTIEEPGCNYEPCASTGGRGDIALPVFSARLYTQGSFSVRFGRIEFRAKMPRGDWLWPALWMMPENEDFYGPYPSDGEIDVLETRGNREYREWEQGPSVGVDWASSTMHWGPDEEHNGFEQTEWQWYGSDLSDDFHLYEIEWTDTHATFRIDGEEIGSVYPPEGGFWEMGGFEGENIWADGGRMAPFDRPFYIIINVAVGGRFFPDDAWSPNGRPWDWESGHPLMQFYEAQDRWLRTWDRPELVVDYVRVYEI